jgi:ribose-phosphate pyrophosphokinase
MPALPYQRADRAVRRGEAIGGRAVAKRIGAQAHRVIVVDLHNATTAGFFDIPVRMLEAGKLLAQEIRATMPSGADIAIVALDAGAHKRAADFARLFGDAPLVTMAKQRIDGSTTKVLGINGDVKGKHCVIVEDMIATGSSAVGAVNALITAGATSVDLVATHPVFVKNAAEKLEASPFRRVFVTNTVPMLGFPGIGALAEDVGDTPSKIRWVSVGPLVADAIRDAHRAYLGPLAPQRSRGAEVAGLAV